ncbi:DUF2625 family protein [Niastella sp. OAS944]|uniref:DUF2625 family protein n=1 Tax=Niastella sp. OAS944 TaxID=2664089 RepID=UPI0035C86399
MYIYASYIENNSSKQNAPGGRIKLTERVKALDGNMVFNFVPFLWTKEGKDINKNKRKAVPVEEQFSLNLDFRKQLGLDK